MGNRWARKSLGLCLVIAIVALLAAAIVGPPPRSDVQVVKVATGPRPYDIAVTADSVWVVNFEGSSLTRISRQTRKPIATIPVGSQPDGVIASEESLWVTSTADNALYLISPAANRVIKRVAVRDPAPGASPSTSDIWIGGLPADHVVAFDRKTGEPHAMLPLRGAGWTATGDGAIWVGSVLENTVSRLNPATGAVDATVSLPAAPWRLAWRSGALWTTSYEGDAAFRISTEANTLVATVPISGHAKGLDIGDDGLVHIASHTNSLLPTWRWLSWADPKPSTGYLTTIDPQTNSVIRRVSTGSRVNGALALADGWAWVADIRGGGVFYARD